MLCEILVSHVNFTSYVLLTAKLVSCRRLFARVSSQICPTLDPPPLFSLSLNLISIFHLYVFTASIFLLCLLHDLGGVALLADTKTTKANAKVELLQHSTRSIITANPRFSDAASVFAGRATSAGACDAGARTGAGRRKGSARSTLSSVRRFLILLSGMGMCSLCRSASLRLRQTVPQTRRQYVPGRDGAVSTGEAVRSGMSWLRHLPVGYPRPRDSLEDAGSWLALCAELQKHASDSAGGPRPPRHSLLVVPALGPLLSVVTVFG